MKVIATASTAVAATLIFGGAANAETPDAAPNDYLSDVRLGDKVDRICFRDQINDFRDGTETTIIVERGAKDYLIETEKPCNELDGAQTISLNNAFSSGRCVTSYDRFSASKNTSTSASDPAYLCRIQAIYEWNEDALESEVASIN